MASPPTDPVVMRYDDELLILAAATQTAQEWAERIDGGRTYFSPALVALLRALRARLYRRADLG